MLQQIFQLYSPNSTECDISARNKCIVRDDFQDDTEDNHETDSDLESEGEIEDDTSIVLSTFVVQIGTTRFYRTCARDLVHIPTWTYQRCIVPDHLNSLTNAFRSTNRCTGTVKAIQNRNGDLRIIDGQHRIAAWKLIMESDPRWNIEVMFEVYNVDDTDSKDAFNLFKQVNNVRNINVSDLPSEVASKILRKFKTEWPDVLKIVSNGKRVYRPKVDSRKLYLKLKEYLESSDMSEAEVWQQMTEMNRIRSNWPCSRFKCTKKTLDKARQLGCYLGLDPKLSWLDQVY